MFFAEHGNAIEESGNDLSIYPNPAKDKVNINFGISKDGKVKIELHNLLGEKIEDIVDMNSLKGNYSKEINISSLPLSFY